MSDEERARDIVSWHHDSAPLLVKDLVVAFATVRAEEREACAKVVEGSGLCKWCLEETAAAIRVRQ